MVFHIFDIASFSHMEGMDPVMAGLGATFPVDAASGDDRHVRAVFNIEVIIDHINAFLAHDHRNVHLLVFRLAADMDIDPRLVFFSYDPDMAAVPVAHGHAIQPQVVGALLVEPVGVDHIQHCLCDLVKVHFPLAFLRRFLRDLLHCFFRKRLLILHRAHLPFVSCTRRNPVPG